VSTKAEIQKQIVALAEKTGIAQYEAAMVLYTQASKRESEAKGDKEKLKEIVDKQLALQGKRAHMVAIPGSDQFATAYHYEQRQPKWNEEKARELVPETVLNQILTREPADCFTVKPMNEDAARNRVEESNAQKLADADGSLGSKGPTNG
jgi:hypothetical protein